MFTINYLHLSMNSKYTDFGNDGIKDKQLLLMFLLLLNMSNKKAILY